MSRSSISASLVFGLFLLVDAASAIVVTTSVDESDSPAGAGFGISLREAIALAAPGEELTFDPSISGETIRLVLGEIELSKSVSIDGSALADPVTISGDRTGDGPSADDSRVFRIFEGEIALRSMGFSGGYSAEGAAIRISGATTKVRIYDSSFISNTSTSEAGAVFYLGSLSGTSFLGIENCVFDSNSAATRGGAVRTFGNSLISRSTFRNNQSVTSGGAYYNRNGTCEIRDTLFEGNSSGEGGAISSFGTTVVERSTIRENSATLGGGLISEDGLLELEACLVLENTASRSGGGLYGETTSEIRNSTFANNAASERGGAIYCNNGMEAKVLFSTITGNTASTAGGIYDYARATLALWNSIVAGNSAQVDPNLSGFDSGGGNLTSGDPQLAHLGDYGGPTLSTPPLLGSPAIDDAVDPPVLDREQFEPAIDQRGFPRIGLRDIGASEFLDSEGLAEAWNTDTDGDGIPFGVEQAVGTSNFVSDVGSSRSLSSLSFNEAGQPVLFFGIAGNAVAGTRWALLRSHRLVDQDFEEIYQFDGVVDTPGQGVSISRSSDGVSIVDTAASLDMGLYRFEARYEP